MNDVVRNYLIELARTKDKLIYYSDLVKECNLGFDLNTYEGLYKLRSTLGEVSIYENQHDRPLISALAIYKDPKKNDQGDGFFKLAESLGKGKAKSLREDFYGFQQVQASREFWQNDSNYMRYGPQPVEERRIDNNYFTRNELDFFIAWHSRPYDKDDPTHHNAKEHLMNTVWEKTAILCRMIVAELPGFSLENKKVWSQRGWAEKDGVNRPTAIFKPYTWVKIFRNTDSGRDVYFTFEINALEEAFVYKIDCRKTRDSKLTEAQIELCKSLTPLDARWNEISFEELLKLDWQSLKDKCVKFIEDFLKYYDAIIDAIWGEKISPEVFKNTLIRRDKPNQGIAGLPDSKKNFEGVDIDFLKEAQEQKKLGDSGEMLVKQYEIRILKQRNQFSEADKVEIVQDGKGYDVLSYDADGNEKYIEVKTTIGNQMAPFYLSDNEFAFMKANLNSYFIYRLYNYDEDNGFAEFYELSGDVQGQTLMQPTEYRVFLKDSLLH